MERNSVEAVERLRAQRKEQRLAADREMQSWDDWVGTCSACGATVSVSLKQARRGCPECGVSGNAAD